LLWKYNTYTWSFCDCPSSALLPLPALPLSQAANEQQAANAKINLFIRICIYLYLCSLFAK